MQTYTTRQKIILTIYAIISLPILLIAAILWPLAKWTASGDSMKKVLSELTLVEFLSLSVALSLYVYLYAWLLRLR